MERKGLAVKLTGLSEDIVDLNTPHEVVLIDANIYSLRDVPLGGHVQTLNLHYNHITKIENLHHLRTLKHLDLSSNQITELEGLESLHSLKTLNVSCNRICVIKGLSALGSLKKLNLSYNQISDLSGLVELHGPNYQLTHLNLHGNHIQSVNHLVECVVGCIRLSHLTLMHDGRGNPVCQLPGYRSGVINSVPQLEILDGLDRNGEVANGDSGLSDIPGLEDYLEYLDSSDKQDNLLPLAFPKIDEALQQFRQRGCVSTDQSSTTDQEDMEIRIKATRMSPRFKSKPIPEKKVTTDHEVRIEKLEQELAQFLCVKDDNNKRGKGGETDTTESISSPEDSRHRYISNRKKNLLAAQRDVSTDESSKPSDTKGKKLRTSRIPTHSHQKKTVPAKPVKTARPKGSSNSTQVSSSPPSAGEQQTRRPTTVQDDEDKLCLMQELDNERERRWKAEQAARKLVDHIKEIQSKGSEQREVQDVAIETSTRLKQALVREREEKNRLEKLVSELEERVSKLTEKLESSQDSEESQRKALRAMETTATKIESEKIEQLAHERKKTQDYQMKAVAASREVDLLRNMVKKHEGKIQQLQELLASREQDHRHNMKNKYSLESRELQDVLTKAVNSEREKHELDVRLYKEKVDVLTHQYADLEDEFRLALQIEANRFKEVQEAFEKVSEESAQHKQAMVTLHDKEQKCSALVTELTSMVKEQKGRLSELSRSKQEALAEAKERLQTVEAHLDEARRRMVQMEMLKQEKTKLQAQITAQESLIEGLRVEKRLWSQELAQQGASLAQDRGRLDARVDALAAEVSSLKKQQERDQDALRIKCKMIEDQTETIKKLKEGLIERDAEIKEARDDSLKMQKSLEEQLSEEKITNQDLQDSVERLTERKEGLKQQLADTQIELDESRKAHQSLDKKWKDRAELIGTLEAQVKKVKENYDEKEKKLTKERDNAVSAEKAAAERLRSIDDAFRKQLEAAQHSHKDQIEQLQIEKQEEINQANQRVFDVEDEMRQLLIEMENNKKTTEAKIKKFSKAFSDLQHNL